VAVASSLSHLIAFVTYFKESFTSEDHL